MIEDGGPAFPSGTMIGRGMSLRDWFAGQPLTEPELTCLRQQYFHQTKGVDVVSLHTLRYFHADQMLKKREVEPPFVPTTNARDIEGEEREARHGQGGPRTVIRCVTCGEDRLGNQRELAAKNTTIRELREAVEVLAKMAVAGRVVEEYVNWGNLDSGIEDMEAFRDAHAAVIANPIATAALSANGETKKETPGG